MRCVTWDGRMRRRETRRKRRKRTTRRKRIRYRKVSNTEAEDVEQQEERGELKKYRTKEVKQLANRQSYRNDQWRFKMFLYGGAKSTNATFKMLVLNIDI